MPVRHVLLLSARLRAHRAAAYTRTRERERSTPFWLTLARRLAARQRGPMCRARCCTYTGSTLPTYLVPTCTNVKYNIFRKFNGCLVIKINTETIFIIPDRAVQLCSKRMRIRPRPRGNENGYPYPSVPVSPCHRTPRRPQKASTRSFCWSQSSAGACCFCV